MASRPIPLVTDGDFPSNLRFLPGVDSVLIYGQDELPAYDMLCLIDCADRRRLGNFAKDDPSRLDGNLPIVNIDHHITNDRFGDVNIVEPEASSSARSSPRCSSSGAWMSTRYRPACWPASTATRSACARSLIALAPFFISTTSSTGTRIWPNWSAISERLIRSVRARFALLLEARVGVHDVPAFES